MENVTDTLYPTGDIIGYPSKLSVYVDVRYLYITILELRRQTILMEKQNELLEEQNNLTRMQIGMFLKCIPNVYGGGYGGCVYEWRNRE